MGCQVPAVLIIISKIILYVIPLPTVRKSLQITFKHSIVSHKIKNTVFTVMKYAEVLPQTTSAQAIKAIAIWPCMRDYTEYSK